MTTCCRWTVAERGALRQHRGFLDQFAEAAELLPKLAAKPAPAGNAKHGVKQHDGAKDGMALLDNADVRAIASQRTASGRMDAMLRALMRHEDGFVALVAALQDESKRAEIDTTAPANVGGVGKLQTLKSGGTHPTTRTDGGIHGTHGAHGMRAPTATGAHVRAPPRKAKGPPPRKPKRVPKTHKAMRAGLIESSREAQAHMFPEAAEEAKAAEAVEAAEQKAKALVALTQSFRAGNGGCPGSSGGDSSSKAPAAPAVGTKKYAALLRAHELAALRRAGLAAALADDAAQRGALIALFEATGGVVPTSEVWGDATVSGFSDSLGSGAGACHGRNEGVVGENRRRGAEPLMAEVPTSAVTGWSRADFWGTDAPLPSWHGVTIGEGGRVVALRLASNGLSGVLPDAFVALASGEAEERRCLEGVALASEATRQRGAKKEALPPPPVPALAHLRVLQLQSNALRGALPPNLLRRLPALETLWLHNNALEGPLPSFGAPPLREDGQADGARLESVRLDNNCFGGKLPKTLGKLARLKELELERNRLDGGLPAGLAALNRAATAENGHEDEHKRIGTSMGGRSTMSRGTIAKSRLGKKVGGESSRRGRSGSASGGLMRFTAHANRLSGEVPAALLYGSGAAGASLRTLTLGGNRLSGTLPSPKRDGHGGDQAGSRGGGGDMSMRMSSSGGSFSASGARVQIGLSGNQLRGRVPASLQPRLGGGMGITAAGDRSITVDLRHNKLALTAPRADLWKSMHSTY